MGLPGKPAASAPARPGSPAPIASGLLRPTPPNPPRQLPIQSPAATPPWAQSLFFRIKRQATSHLRKKESCAYDLFQGIDELVRKKDPLSAAELEEESNLRVRIGDRARAIGCAAGYGLKQAQQDNNRLHQLYCKRISPPSCGGGALPDGEDTEEAH